MLNMTFPKFLWVKTGGLAVDKTQDGEVFAFDKKKDEDIPVIMAAQIFAVNGLEARFFP